jgi:hemoglobin-like flavoprotein
LQCFQYQQTDVDKYATTIKATWNTVLETLAWDDIGHAIYTNLFEIEPSLEGMFTHDRRVMGSRWLDKFSSLILECHNPPAIHESLEMIAPFHIRVGLKVQYPALGFRVLGFRV